MKLRFDLREMLDEYEARTGMRVHYTELAKEADLSVETVKSLATRKDYNPTFDVISKIGDVLSIDPRPFFVWDAKD